MAMTLPFHTLRWVTRNYYKMPRSFDGFQGTNQLGYGVNLSGYQF